ncbi:MAG: retroviral-like aspartic protease family protein [Acidobacteriota bacterium]
MGRVLVDLKVSNFEDLPTKKKKVRSILVKDALIDTGAAMLALHKSDIQTLGLRFLRKVKVRTASGSPERRVFGVARVRIEGREGEFDVLEIPDSVPPLFGYIVMERLDLAVDPSRMKVIRNPEHGGDYALDLF